MPSLPSTNAETRLIPSVTIPTLGPMRLRTLAPTLAMISACAAPPPHADRPAHVTDLSTRLAARAASRPLVVAHRGASAAFPENTIPAFRAGIEAHADLVELDFHASADGVLLCLHDKTLDRTTNANQLLGGSQIAVAGTPWSTLSVLDAGSWKAARFADARIPTLEEALETICPNAIPMVEHKAGTTSDLLAALDRSGQRRNALVQSFDWGWLRELRERAPDLTLAALGSGALTPERLASIDALGVSMVHWNHRDLTMDDLAALHARGYMVCVYTVDDPAWLASAPSRRLDAVTTNEPGLARRIFESPSTLSTSPR